MEVFINNPIHLFILMEIEIDGPLKVSLFSTLWDYSIYG